MGWAKWWFVDVPEWAWHLVERHGGLSFGAVVLLALMALVYVAVTLAVLAGACRLLAWAGQAFRRGWDKGSGRAGDA
ncbi:hypothetical protein ACFYRN_24845 [Streptomyces sp. NPDC005227]|uniref:hypothetical protein n=1 Tax=Streptomyces sp. NPDC005227 TaxID=3364707 RepID=UPI0036CF3888